MVEPGFALEEKGTGAEMIVCPWRKKYEADIAREEPLAAKFKPMYGPNGPSPNIHALCVETARDSLRRLDMDHKQGGCICQAPGSYGHFK
jgi:hypothetical protein